MKQTSLLRLLGFVVGLLLEACSGTLYAWSSYSTALGDQLGYGKTELAVIVGIGNNGLYLSSVAVGFLIVAVGPRWSSLVGGGLLFFGYAMMAFTYSGQIANGHYLLMSFYFCIAGIGSSCAYIAGLAPNVTNFGLSTRGLVVGLLVSMYGLSALIFTQFNTALFVDTVMVAAPNATAVPSGSPPSGGGGGGGEGELVPVEVADTFSYLLFLAYVPAIVCVIGAVSLWEVGPDEAARGGEATGSTVASNTINESSESDPLLLTNPNVKSPGESEYSTVRLARSLDFWLMFVAFLFGSGAGLTYINSVGYIVGSLTSTPEDARSWTDLQVSLISAMSCTGRIGIGLLSDQLLRWNIRRRVLFSWSIGLMLLGQFLMLFVNDLSFLTVVTVIIGLAYGAMFSISPTIVSDRFGVKSFGVNWGWMCWATAIGGQVMTLIFGVIYDSNADESEHCGDGPSCYLDAFYINTCACVLGLVVAAVFSARRKVPELASLKSAQIKAKQR